MTPSNNFPKLHNAAWPGVVGKGGDGEPPIDLDTMLDLTAAALVADPELAGYKGNVADSGEGRWTVKAAIDTGVPAPVLSSALYDRFTSRGNADFANKLLSAMRQAFGGHVEKHRETN